MFKSAKKSIQNVVETTIPWSGYKDTTAELLTVETATAPSVTEVIAEFIADESAFDLPAAVLETTTPVEVKKIAPGMTSKKAAREAKAAAIAEKATTVTKSEAADERKARACALFASSTPDENKERLLAVLSRPEGASLRDIHEAGYWVAAQAALKIAEKAGYETRSDGAIGSKRYHAERKV
jgi:hypothetical protein